jgi:hypothetical protein
VVISSSSAISSGLDELALDVHDLVQLLDHVHRDADRAGLVGNRARHGLPDPPGRVGRKLVALAIVELLDRADQTERAFLDQVEEAEPAAEVGLGDRDHQPEVRLDHLRLRRHVAALDALGEIDLLVGRQQRDLADLAQVEPQRVERRLDAQVELRALLFFRRGELLVRRMLVRLALQQLDPVVDEVRIEIFDLLFRELDVFEPGRDLVVVENAFLETFLDEFLQLLDFRKGDFDGEQRRPTSRLSSRWWTGSIYKRKRAGYQLPPRLTLCGRILQRFGRKQRAIFFSS